MLDSIPPLPPPLTDSHAGYLGITVLRNSILENLENKRTGRYSCIEEAFLKSMPAAFLPMTVKFEEVLPGKLLCFPYPPTHSLPANSIFLYSIEIPFVSISNVFRTQ